MAYGDPSLLDECLASLKGVYWTLVIDNSVSDATREVVERQGATYLSAGSNLGFAAAVNLGLSRRALPSADVLLLNPDATISPKAIEALREKLHEAPDIACVAPAQRRPDSAEPSPVFLQFHQDNRFSGRLPGERRLSFPAATA